jgi:hypothetical protein
MRHTLAVDRRRPSGVDVGRPCGLLPWSGNSGNAGGRPRTSVARAAGCALTLPAECGPGQERARARAGQGKSGPEQEQDLGGADCGRGSRGRCRSDAAGGARPGTRRSDAAGGAKAEQQADGTAGSDRQAGSNPARRARDSTRRRSRPGKKRRGEGDPSVGGGGGRPGNGWRTRQPAMRSRWPGEAGPSRQRPRQVELHPVGPPPRRRDGRCAGNCGPAEGDTTR